MGRLKNVEEVRVTHVIENQCSVDLRKVQNISKFLKIISNSTISLTTYKKSGDEVHTPVWVVNIDERGFVRTSIKAGKLKRIRNNSNVIIAACTSRGKINGDKVLAKAVVIEPRNGEYKMINKLFINRQIIEVNDNNLKLPGTSKPARGPKRNINDNQHDPKTKRNEQ